MKTSLLPFAGALTVAPQAETIPQPPSELAQGDSAFGVELADAILKESDFPSLTTASEPEAETETASEEPDLEDSSEETKEVQVATWCFLPPVEVPIVVHMPAPEAQSSESDVVQNGASNRLDTLLPVTREMAAVVQNAPEQSKPAVVPPENAAGQGGANCPPQKACSALQEDSIPASAAPKLPAAEDLAGVQAKELPAGTPKSPSEVRVKSSEMPIEPTEKLENHWEPPEERSNTMISTAPQASKPAPEPPPAKAQMRGVESSGTLVAPRDARMNLPETKQMSVEPTAPEAVLAPSSEFSLKTARAHTQADLPKPVRAEGYQAFLHSQETSSDVSTSFRLAESMDLQDVSQPAAPVRLVQSIMHEVSALKTLKGSAMSVVLKPDSETQLSVRIEYREGVIEASATCEKGDFGLLQSQWPDLRRTLESQGVRLGDLDRGPGANASFQQGTGDSSRKHSQADPSREESGFFHVPVNKPSTSSPRLQRAANSSRLLESWA